MEPARSITRLEEHIHDIVRANWARSQRRSELVHHHRPLTRATKTQQLAALRKRDDVGAFVDA